MNWYHRGEERYVEYGSSFQATRAFGVVRSLYDTVYNMNMAHLTRAHKTVFEHLDDAGLRTACTTWLIYRGRTRHDPSGASVYRRIAEAAQFRHAVYGAGELFYADLFDSRNTGCTSALGMPGQRDQHTGCVGRLPGRARPVRLPAVLAARQRHPLPQGRAGRAGALDRGGRPRARADRARGRRGGRVPRGARGDRHVRPLADDGRGARSTWPTPSPTRACSAPSDPAPTEAELAVSPAARSAMVYALDESRRDELVAGAVCDAARPGGRGPRRHARGRRGGRAQPRAASCASLPAGTCRDRRGADLAA